MILRKSDHNAAQVDLALEASIHIGLTILLAISCLLILRPFIPLVAWGIIIAVAAYPTFKKLQSALGNRRILAAALFALLLLALLTIPVILLGETLFGTYKKCVTWDLTDTWVDPGVLDGFLLLTAFPAFVLGRLKIVKGTSMLKICQHCLGSKIEPKFNSTLCRNCDGKGTVETPDPTPPPTLGDVKSEADAERHRQRYMSNWRRHSRDDDD